MNWVNTIGCKIIPLCVIAFMKIPEYLEAFILTSVIRYWCNQC